MPLNPDPVVQKVLLLFALLVSHIDRDCLAQQSSGYSRPDGSTCVVRATTQKHRMQRKTTKLLKPLKEITSEHKYRHNGLPAIKNWDWNKIWSCLYYTFVVWYGNGKTVMYNIFPQLPKKNPSKMTLQELKSTQSDIFFNNLSKCKKKKRKDNHLAFCYIS